MGCFSLWKSEKGTISYGENKQKGDYPKWSNRLMLTDVR